MYDGWVEGDIKNVYSVQYKNSEAGYLAGVLAGSMTTAKGDPKLNPDNVIGFIGGRDITGINDFFVGYIAGAQKVNPAVKIVYNYVNSFYGHRQGQGSGPGAVRLVQGGHRLPRCGPRGTRPLRRRGGDRASTPSASTRTRPRSSAASPPRPGSSFPRP